MDRRKFLTIVNPHGGRRRGLAVLEQVRPIFAEAEIELEIRSTQYGGHAREITRDENLDGYDAVCVLGGDGTLHEAVNGLLEARQSVSIPIGVIPTGSGNDAARQLGTLDPLAAARNIVAGRTTAYDVSQVTTNEGVGYCLILVGWAGVSDVNARAERLRSLGPIRYAVSASWQIAFPKPLRSRLEIDDVEIEDEFLLVAICNTAQVGSGMKLAPRASIGDGKLDVIIVRRASRWQLLRIFARVYEGTHVQLPEVECFQARRIVIHADDGSQLDQDGEVKGAVPATIEIVPNALQFYCSPRGQMPQ